MGDKLIIQNFVFCGFWSLCARQAKLHCTDIQESISNWAAFIPAYACGSVPATGRTAWPVLLTFSVVEGESLFLVSLNAFVQSLQETD